jgi:tocopherol O-methyltransferase
MFACQDVETVEYPARSFDVIWSIECTEHLFDKPRFFRRAASWLRPGGRLAICAFMVGDLPSTPEVARQIGSVCEGFLCPSLGTVHDYRTWIDEAGLEIRSYNDLTEKVMRTWEVGPKRVHHSRMYLLAPLLGPTVTGFLGPFDAILDAYRTGAMRYGSWVAQLPT